MPDTYLYNFNSNLRIIWDIARGNMERNKLKAIEKRENLVKIMKMED